MKRFTSVFLVFLITFFLFVGNAFAFTDYSGDIEYSGSTEAYAIMLFDADSQTILYQKNIDEEIEPASTTKIMTLILAIENGDMDEKVTVSSKAANMSGSLLHPHLKVGEEIVFKDLINGMMMASGNDAATAVAEAVGGSVDGFVDMMNAKAAEIGMTHTHFVTPHGKHADDHKTTARDMAILTLYALKNPQFVEIVNQESYIIPATNKYSSERTEKNTNKLLRTDESNYYYQYATGIKTGSTPAPYAEDCLVASATKNDMNLICMVFKVKENDPVRWTMTKELFEWGFENYKTIEISGLIKAVDTVQAGVENYDYNDPGDGLLEFDKPAVGSEYYVTLSKAEADALLDGTDSIEAKPELASEAIQAPVSKGDILGTVKYVSKNDPDTVFYEGSLIASRDIDKEGSSGGITAVVTMKPSPTATPADDAKKGSAALLLLLIPAGLIAFLVVRMMTANRRKSRRFKRRSRPHYRYRK